MTSTIDPKTIGKPVRPRRHVRSLTGKHTACSLFSMIHQSRCRILSRARRVGQGKMAFGWWKNLEEWSERRLQWYGFGNYIGRLDSPTDNSLQMFHRSPNRLWTMCRLLWLVSLTTLVRSQSCGLMQTLLIYDQDTLGAYQAAALSVRDNLIVRDFASLSAYIYSFRR